MNAGHWLSRDENAGRLESKILKDSQGLERWLFPQKTWIQFSVSRWQFTVAYNFSSGASNALFQSQWALHAHGAQAKYNKNNDNKKFSKM